MELGGGWNWVVDYVIPCFILVTERPADLTMDPNVTVHSVSRHWGPRRDEPNSRGQGERRGGEDESEREREKGVHAGIQDAIYRVEMMTKRKVNQCPLNNSSR